MNINCILYTLQFLPTTSITKLLSSNKLINRLNNNYTWKLLCEREADPEFVKLNMNYLDKYKLYRKIDKDAARFKNYINHLSVYKSCCYYFYAISAVDLNKLINIKYTIDINYCESPIKKILGDYKFPGMDIKFMSENEEIINKFRSEYHEKTKSIIAYFTFHMKINYYDAGFSFEFKCLNKSIYTSVAQLNFLKWLNESGCASFILDNEFYLLKN